MDFLAWLLRFQLVHNSAEAARELRRIRINQELIFQKELEERSYRFEPAPAHCTYNCGNPAIDVRPGLQKRHNPLVTIAFLLVSGLILLLLTRSCRQTAVQAGALSEPDASGVVAETADSEKPSIAELPLQEGRMPEEIMQLLGDSAFGTSSSLQTGGLTGAGGQTTASMSTPSSGASPRLAGYVGENAGARGGQEIGQNVAPSASGQNSARTGQWNGPVVAPCLIVKHKGTIGRRLMFIGLTGLPIAPGPKYELVDTVNYAAENVAFMGKELKKAQVEGVRVVILEKKYRLEDLQAARQSCGAPAQR